MTRSGLILDDRYRLDERIAAGGVGQVWRATDLLLERAVAVKVLRPEYADHPETLDRFRKEARHAGAVSNAHVAQLYDYGPSGPGGSPYLVMEYVDGPSLADILAVDPVEPARALDIVAQAADGLSAAHRAGLVHRDVKPGNILIGKDGQVKVTDFGIAHAAGQAPVTGPGLVMGTTQYMAPERIAGGHATAASDLYALGIVLHECLTGVPPHDGSPAEVMAAHLYLPLPPLPADTPPELVDLVARLTVKDPAPRIGDAAELAELAALLRDSLSGVTHPATSGATAPGFALPSGAAGPSPALAAAYAAPGAGGTAAMPSPGVPVGPLSYLPEEWNVSTRISDPTRPSQAGQPGTRQRRKTGTIVAGSALVAAIGLVALLLSGALNGTAAANRGPAGSPATGVPTLGRVPSPARSGSGTSTASAAASPGAAAPADPGQEASPSATPSGSPSGHPSHQASSGSPAATAPASAPPATAASTAPGAAPASTAPATAGPTHGARGTHGTPASSPPGASPSPSPSTTGCLFGVCL